jgi:hypothetical protein
MEMQDLASADPGREGGSWMEVVLLPFDRRFQMKGLASPNSQ